MTTKTTIFSALIFGISCTNGLAMHLLDDKDLSDLSEKGFIIRKDCSRETVPCFSEEYYHNVLLPQQQKITTEFPDISPQIALTTILIEQNIKYRRSQGRNMARRLVGTTSPFDDVKNIEFDLYKENDSKK